MKALQYEQFSGIIKLVEVPTPVLLSVHAALVQVKATGICRSDFHAYKGHLPKLTQKDLPFIPGHEFSGLVASVGTSVKLWKGGERVTTPFATACGNCMDCNTGCEHLCCLGSIIGIGTPGSFAEYVVVDHADVNLVRLPEEISFTEGAILGCRFATAYRAIVNFSGIGKADTKTLAVFGCGGVGLSAIMIASALNANVIGIDISADKLSLATKCGASTVLDLSQFASNPNSQDSAVVEFVMKFTNGVGADITIDALGNPNCVRQALMCLRRRGTHLQIGMTFEENGEKSQIPMNIVVRKELQIYGSYGMQARCYSDMLAFIVSKKLDLKLFIEKVISLEEGASLLMDMQSFRNVGINVITI